MSFTYDDEGLRTSKTVNGLTTEYFWYGTRLVAEKNANERILYIYDANTCRFINADGYVSTGQGLLGYNMFAYCNNNPVCYIDYTGMTSQYFVLATQKSYRLYKTFNIPAPAKLMPAPKCPNEVLYAIKRENLSYRHRVSPNELFMGSCRDGKYSIYSFMNHELNMVSDYYVYKANADIIESIENKISYYKDLKSMLELTSTAYDVDPTMKVCAIVTLISNIACPLIDYRISMLEDEHDYYSSDNSYVFYKVITYKFNAKTRERLPYGW